MVLESVEGEYQKKITREDLYLEPRLSRPSLEVSIRSSTGGQASPNAHPPGLTTLDRILENTIQKKRFFVRDVW